MGVQPQKFYTLAMSKNVNENKNDEEQISIYRVAFNHVVML